VARLIALSVTRPVAARRPSFRAGGRLAGWVRSVYAKPQWVVGAIVLVSAALAATFSLQIVSFEPDELGYTHLAIGIAHSLTPITLSYGGAQKLNQLYPLLIAPLWGTFDNVTAFQLTHAWNALLLASAAIPTYLLAEEVLQVRWASYLAAALVALAPWLTLSTGELTEVAAYPACAWALLAMQRSLDEPSPRRDVIALLAIVIAAYGRLQLILLAPAFVLAMLVHELGYPVTVRDQRREALRDAVRRIVRRHVVLSAAGAAGVLIGVPLLVSGRLASAAGFYGDALAGATINSATFDLARSYLTFTALGLAVIPVALAFGFAFVTLPTPLSRRAHAFASMAIVTVCAITIQVAEISVRFNGSTLQERYIFYIAPLFVVGMFAALLATRRPWIAALSGTVVLALLVATTHYESALSAFWYQVSPGMTSFYDLLGPALGASHGSRGAGGSGSMLLTGAIVLAIGVVLTLLVRRWSPRRVLAVAAIALVVVCSAETTHALWKVVHGNSSGPGLGAGSLRDADWIDRAVPAGASAEQWVDNLGGLDTARLLWEGETLWNRSIVGAYTVDGFGDPFLPTTSLVVNSRTGAITTSTGAPQARYVALPTRGFPVVPAGIVLARSPNRKLELLRVAMPMRAAWVVSGVSSDGWLGLYQPATVRLYALRGAAGRCATVGITLSLSAIVSSPQAVTVSAGVAGRQMSIEPGRTQTVDTRVCGDAGGAPALKLSPDQSAAQAPPQLTPQLVRVTVAPA
jgi:hypothetical protein